MKVHATIRTTTVVEIPDKLVEKINDLNMKLDMDIYEEWKDASRDLRMEILDRIQEKLPDLNQYETELMYACYTDLDGDVPIYEE